MLSILLACSAYAHLNVRNPSMGQQADTDKSSSMLQACCLHRAASHHIDDTELTFKLNSKTGLTAEVLQHMDCHAGSLGNARQGGDHFFPANGSHQWLHLPPAASRSKARSNDSGVHLSAHLGAQSILRTVLPGSSGRLKPDAVC